MATQSLKSVLARMEVLARQIQLAQREMEQHRKEMVDALGIGRHELATVYRVRRVTVRRHFRRGFVAMRIRGKS